MHYIILILLFALPMWAAEPADEKERLQRIAAEVERRRILREQVAAAEENARRVLREHESGMKKATEAQLAAARAAVRAADERRAKEGPQKSNAGVKLRLPDVDMITVVTAWRTLYGSAPTVTDRAKSRVVRIEVSALSKDELREKFVTALLENGIYVIDGPNGVVLDTEAEIKQSK